MTKSTVPILIGGKWTEAEVDQWVAVHNPSAGEVIAQTPMCGAKEVDRAVRAARKAFASWSQTPAPKRASVMFRYRELLEANFEELSHYFIPSIV